MSTTLRLNLRDLEAVNLFASRDEGRYTLHGVYIDVGATHYRLVATDGRCIVALRSPLAEATTPCKVTMPSELIDVLTSECVAGLSRARDSVDLTVIPRADNKPAVLRAMNGKFAIECAAVYGNYPSYSQVFVLHRPLGGAVSQLALNAEYLEKFQRAGAIVGGEKVNLILGWPVDYEPSRADGEDVPHLRPVYVQWRGLRAQMAGLLMPIKDEDPLPVFPDWPSQNESAPAEGGAA